MPAALASNGEGFLAFWTNQYRDGGTDVVAIDRHGRAGDPRSMPVPVTAVTRLGDGYLIRSFVQTGQVAGTTQYFETDADGSIIDAWQPAIPTDAVIGATVATTTGERILLIDTVVPGRTFVADRTGRLVATHILPTSTLSATVRISAAPNGFILVTGGWEGVFVQNVPAGGGSPGPRIAVDSASTGIEDQILYVAAASSGDEILVVWSRGAWSGRPRLSSAVVPANGTVTTQPLAVDFEWIERLELQWVENEYVLIANAGNNPASPAPLRLDVVALRLDRGGRPLDSRPVPIAATGGRLPLTSVAFNGSRVYALAVEFLRIGSHVVGASFAVEEAIAGITAETISRREAAQTFPRAATDGVNSLVVWREATSEWQALRARSVSPRGEPRNEPIELIRVAGFIGDHEVAFGQGMYVVVWMHWTSVLASRFDMDGELLDTVPIAVHSGSQPQNRGRPAVSWNGTAFVIVWSEQQLVATTLSPSGVVGPTRIITAAAPRSAATTPVLAWNGSQTLLAWTRVTSPLSVMPCSGCEEYAIHTALLDQAGVPIGSTERLLVNKSRWPAAASNGTDFLVAHQRLGLSSAVEAVRLTAMNEITGQVRIADESYAGSVTAAGRDYIIIHGRNAAAVVAVTRLSPDGTKSTSVTPARSTFQFGQDVTVNAAGELLIVVPDFLMSPGDPQRTWRIIGYGNEDLKRTGRVRAVGR